METITLKKCDDGTIWVTSDENQNGTESSFVKITDKKEQFMIALAEFLGFEPVNVLNFKSIQNIDNKAKSKIYRKDYEPCIIHFKSLCDANLVKEQLKDIMRMYDCATVADLYDLVGFSTTYTDNKYGWVKWSGFEIEQCDHGGYFLTTPKPLPII